jgi:hypothetical protein
MAQCTCCGGSVLDRTLDEDGRCPECHRIADTAAARNAVGQLAYPDFSAKLEAGKPIPADPKPTRPDAPCDACTEPLGNEQRPYSTQGREFFVHDRCWSVMLTL